MFNKSFALAGILASILMFQASGCVAPDPIDSPASEAEVIVIDTDDIEALRAGEHITVDLTAADAVYRIEFSSLADLDAIHVIASDGEHVLGKSIEIHGELEAGVLLLTPTHAKLLPPQSTDADLLSPQALDQAELSGFCVQVCCWHLICFIEK